MRPLVFEINIESKALPFFHKGFPECGKLNIGTLLCIYYGKITLSLTEQTIV